MLSGHTLAMDTVRGTDVNLFYNYFKGGGLIG
jgi:hypothetical protein